MHNGIAYLTVIGTQGCSFYRPLFAFYCFSWMPSFCFKKKVSTSETGTKQETSFIYHSLHFHLYFMFFPMQMFPLMPLFLLPFSANSYFKKTTDENTGMVANLLLIIHCEKFLYIDCIFALILPDIQSSSHDCTRSYRETTVFPCNSTTNETGSDVKEGSREMWVLEAFQTSISNKMATYK